MEVIDATSFIHQFREIFVDQVYKFETTNSEPVVVDCGANVGLATIYFKINYPNCKLRVFEPDPEIYKTLQSNILTNLSSTNVELFNSAIWISNLGVDFLADGADGGTVASSSATGLSVSSVRLKDVITGGEPIDFLKIDIEGAEFDVLIDCNGSLGNVRNIFFEYHSYRNQEQKLGTMLELLTKNGFRYYIQSPSMTSAPLMKRGGIDKMDLQLNVYCFRS